MELFELVGAQDLQSLALFFQSTRACTFAAVDREDLFNPEFASVPEFHIPVTSPNVPK
jgi:hypothetical protein